MSINSYVPLASPSLGRVLQIAGNQMSLSTMNPMGISNASKRSLVLSVKQTSQAEYSCLPVYPRRIAISAPFVVCPF